MTKTELVSSHFSELTLFMRLPNHGVKLCQLMSAPTHKQRCIDLYPWCHSPAHVVTSRWTGSKSHPAWKAAWYSGKGGSQRTS